jgi:lysophospholipase L1-like esterase
MHKLFLRFLITPFLCSAVFGQTAETNSELQSIQKLLADKVHPLTWVLTGDSITHGAKHTHGNRSYVEHFAERVRWELGRPNDIVINTGISGDKAEGILGKFDWRIARFKPDVVSIMIGMNDCTRGPEKRDEFQKNLRDLIHRVRDLGAFPVLHTMNIVEPSATKERGDLSAYVDIVNGIAREEKTILVDHWRHWKTASENQNVLKEWLNDPIHPNARGHREMAILTFKTLGIFDPKSPTCQPTAP